MWVLSGVFFSSSNFPAVVQPVIHALPLTALVDALRAVVLEGASLGGDSLRAADADDVGDRDLLDRPANLQVAVEAAVRLAGAEPRSKIPPGR